MDVDIAHHPWFPFLCDWTSSIPKRSPLPLLSLVFSVQCYPQMTHALMRDWKLTELFNCIQSPLCAFLQNCIFSPVFEKAYPPQLSRFRGKEDQKKILKRQLLWPFQLLFLNAAHYNESMREIVCHRWQLSPWGLVGISCRELRESEQYASSLQLFG